MAYATDVKIFWCDPGMTSISPLVGGTAGRGTMTAVFDACLVNGYGLKTADSIVVSGGIATANFSTGHEYGKWQVALIAGAAPAELNGEKRILSVTTNTITFDAAGIADGTATGTITVKIAPLGWLKPFSATNKSVYKIDTTKYPTASDAYLRVDDSASTYSANVSVYESMTSVDSGADKMPTVGQAASGWTVGRCETAGLNRYWVLIGDGRGFYFIPHNYSATLATPVYGANTLFFGDPITSNEADPYKFILTAQSVSDDSPQTTGIRSVIYSTAPTYCRRVRAANRVTKSVSLTCAGRISVLVHSGSNSGGGVPFPNTQDGALQLSKIHILENEIDFAYLGYFPGGYFVENKIGDKIHASRLERIYDSNSPAFPERVIVYLLTAYSAATPGVTAFDIIGPWR